MEATNGKASMADQQEIKKRNTRSYKTEWEKSETRLRSMTFTASLGYIIAGMEFIGIVILLLK